ncbi:MAG TPA: rRNA maturation RNase YbeY [Burkholderiales bacterium]|nr:rRNA maturation RNase YbeY [Burkholderiales bacterium]
MPSSSDLRRWLKAALNRDAEITVRLVAESEARRLNRDYRGKDYPTNVLTFIYENAPALAGDVVLCVPIIAREAREQRKELTAHFAHLVIHGALHLQGYDHEREEDARQMEALESAILVRLGFSDPYV